jgi:hypothetical protein
MTAVLPQWTGFVMAFPFLQGSEKEVLEARTLVSSARQASGQSLVMILRALKHLRSQYVTESAAIEAFLAACKSTSLAISKRALVLILRFCFVVMDLACICTEVSVQCTALDAFETGLQSSAGELQLKRLLSMVSASVKSCGSASQKDLDLLELKLEECERNSRRRAATTSADDEGQQPVFEPMRLRDRKRQAYAVACDSGEDEAPVASKSTCQPYITPRPLLDALRKAIGEKFDFDGYCCQAVPNSVKWHSRYFDKCFGYTVRSHGAGGGVGWVFVAHASTDWLTVPARCVHAG